MSIIIGVSIKGDLVMEELDKDPLEPNTAYMVRIILPKSRSHHILYTAWFTGDTGKFHSLVEGEITHFAKKLDNPQGFGRRAVA